jgi:uncharacterized RDD family membrane protein YckC
MAVRVAHPGADAHTQADEPRMAVDPSRHPKLHGTRPGTVLVPQGPLTRGVAFFLDTFLVSMLVGLVLGTDSPLLTVVAATLAADFVYFAVCEGLTGTTLGKRLFGLRVVRAADGRRCGPGAAVVRTVLRLIDNVLFSLPGIAAIVTSPRRQRLGDRAAGTLVVSEVPEQLLRVFDQIYGRGSPDQVLRQINEATMGSAQPHLTSGLERVSDPSPATPLQLAGSLPCPFCDVPMAPDEVVCRYCGQYVNQVTAHGETESMAPVPMLYSTDRRYRFDALWRLVFADHEEALEAARDAVQTWTPADRLLAVNAFGEVRDPRPEAFLDFMAHDPDPAVSALARDVLDRMAATKAGPPQS